ncbi:hypothetical protein NDN08_006975 [Rhodosorus marinus]|uniref:tRNA-splicing endonuclease subunit Sen54 N-terminal domain-containing protein n=1 Tax=Rhodosorus marinus TaxID=101924 RepID=A0AAV8UKR6_9RHOD|nr:hypothetical protein NDN08_006975 [Rhodosorus marinus]
MKGSPGSIGFESKKADVARGELQTRLENVHEKKTRGEIFWTPDGKLVLSVQKGKIHLKMGYWVNRRQYLHPEEALFLIDRGDMKLIRAQGGVVPLEKCWENLLSTEELKQTYHAYAFLRRSGFILRVVQSGACKSSNLVVAFSATKHLSHVKEGSELLYRVAVVSSRDPAPTVAEMQRFVSQDLSSRSVLAVVDDGSVLFHEICAFGSIFSRVNDDVASRANETGT